jgi:hypothetical protein
VPVGATRRRDARGARQRSLRLYHLSDQGLHRLVTCQQTDPATLAARWQTRERDMLQLLPRLPDLVLLQKVVYGLAMQVPAALAVLGRPAVVRWRWVRDYRYRFLFRERPISCSANAALVLAVSPVMAPGPERAISWYSLWVLLDADVGPASLTAGRLAALARYRECTERWTIAAHFPLVLVITPAASRAEHWQRLNWETAARRAAGPLVGAITWAKPDDLARNPWRAIWHTLGELTPCRLPDLLVPMPVQAVPAGLLCSPPAPAGSPSPGAAPRIIRGGFTDRSTRLGEKRGAHPDGREATLLLALVLGRRHQRILELLLDHPLMSAGELAAVLEVAADSARDYLQKLATLLTRLAGPEQQAHLQQMAGIVLLERGAAWKTNARGAQMPCSLPVRARGPPETDIAAAGRIGMLCVESCAFEIAAL